MEKERKFTNTAKELYELLVNGEVDTEELVECSQEINEIILRLLATKGAVLSLNNPARSYQLMGSISCTPAGTWGAAVTLEPAPLFNQHQDAYANRTFYCL